MEFFGLPTSDIDTTIPYREKLKEIRLIILTVDGVLTDGQIHYTEFGDEVRSFNSRDGVAIKAALANGIKITVISERNSKAVRKRLIELGVTDIYMGIRDKLETYHELKVLYGMKDEHCLYIGDDVSDIPVLEKVGFSCTPLNGIEFLRRNVAYVAAFEGGKGCVRDVIEMVLSEQGKWKFFIKS